MGVVLYPPTKEVVLRVARFGVTTALFLSLLSPNPVEAEVSPQSEPPASTHKSVHEAGFLPYDISRLQLQMKFRYTMPPAYWHAVSICETRGNWKDGGKWGGGLGIYIGTWRRYGGREFASHPSRATPAEQMIVANRIAVLGYQTKNEFMTLEDREKGNSFFRPRAGFFGWGCIKANRYLHPKNWRDNNRKEWRRGKKDVLSNL